MILCYSHYNNTIWCIFRQTVSGRLSYTDRRRGRFFGILQHENIYNNNWNRYAVYKQTIYPERDWGLLKTHHARPRGGSEELPYETTGGTPPQTVVKKLYAGDQLDRH